MAEQPARAAVITGLGVVAPGAIGTEAFWKNTADGRPALDRITRSGCTHLPVTVAGQIDGFDPAATIEETFLVQTDRFTHFALAAAAWALEDARLDPAPASPYTVGVVTAAGSGGGEFGQRELQQLWSAGPRHVGPYQSIAWFYAAATGQISIRGGFKGPCAVVAGDEAGGLDALAHAARLVAHGTDTVLAGAAEAPLAPYSLVCQLGYPELSTTADPARAYAPFTTAATGYVPAEAGAMLVVEAAETAARRGAAPRALLAGHAATFTAPHRRADSRAGLAHAIRTALTAAACAPQDIDVVFADALGTPTADRAEAAALADALGPHAAEVPVTAPKTGIGRAYCAAPVLDAATAVLAMEHRLIPPTVLPPDTTPTCDLNLITTPRPAPIHTALLLSRGLMGTNAALVLRHTP
ncbi:beta-ketoacyl synthase N-terminal-like domain-containing protein [Streptomyces macrosporus]|uniref:Ketosynthase chain-length factor n=1 Tax=Streptomyces macrosporus TaxID=44032 RepID=A0ABN3JH92_9ACTN